MTRIAIRQNEPRWRRCLLLALLLAATAALAGTGSTGEEGSPPHNALTWRRTREGWEQPLWLAPKPRPREVPFHPFFAAALAVLLCAMALVGFEPQWSVHVPPPSPHFRSSASGASLACVTAINPS